MAAPKFGTLVPNRIFVGGISASTSEAELTQLFSAYGNVKATKIISDRAGVSKGYGFVTFETDEEARRLQQESECIILRERKLNIAPAIKKQPFNRLFDGGSDLPSTVPNNAYYYANGLGLTYQGGVTFYTTGAAAPGTPIATPPDSTTMYQTAGIFGPQATSGHQPLSPIVYSCPTPSIYVPQQFPYPPYESYYAAVAGGGPSPYPLYPTPNNGANSHDQQQSQQGQSNGCVSGNNSGSNTGIAGGSATSSSSPLNLGSSLPPSNHFYTHSAPLPPSRHLHHHPPMASNSLPPPPQLDNLYYSLAAPGPPQIPPPPPPQSQHQPIADQQLLLYTTDPSSCQHLVSVSDNQAPGQEVQIYSSGLQVQSQYHQQQMFHQQQQLVRHRRLPGVSQAMTPGRKLPGCASQTGQASGSDTLRRPKVKVKVISQGGVVCKMQDEHCLGGGGDAAGSNMVTMLPITPPATPRTRTVKIVDSVNNSISSNTKPINDACHQMQALVL